ncbi:MAG: DPP IV N-terminal domain-containing protein [Bacteroidales bacterium]|nr:DPP IV N-terminal domain-containing protein [Bacteroidales bacterium]
MNIKKLLLGLALCSLAGPALAQEFNRMPYAYKWLNDKEVVFTYNGRYTDDEGFKLVMPKGKKVEGVQAPEKYADFPLHPEGAVNLTYSPDSTMLAFTRDNDLYVVTIEGGRECRLTFDGTATVMNGYASWVYYEEILGRASRYCAFWWSPDSRRLAFYHFDDTEVPMFPIYSPFGQDGKLRETHYPKVGEKNPEVKVGFVDVPAALEGRPEIVWADFDEKEDQYFGIPFWSDDSRTFYVAHEPRIQNTLDLYAVSPVDGGKKVLYHETYPTWLDWIEGMLFTGNGLYMVRSFETGWQQVYFLGYDGSLRRLTDGPNWRVALVRAEEDGTVYFTAQRDPLHVRQALYKVTPKGEMIPLTDESMSVAGVRFSPDGKYFAAQTSNLSTPTQLRVYQTSKPARNWLVADQKGPQYEPSKYSLGQVCTITHDGFELPGVIYYPAGFDPAKRYPVHVDIYGGPDSPQVHDRWASPQRYAWYAENGIIEFIADCRAAGHNGRAGLDCIYKQLSTVEVEDFVAWARWLQSLPYVQGDKIGVEGFSFGGTMTTLLVATAPDAYHYGIAGGGVYDWMLYDTHYTERFMSTPEDNGEGYQRTRTVDRVGTYPARPAGSAPAEGTVSDGSVMLKLTHGTGDDNVHFQNTLQLIDALHRMGADFDFMVYPDGMHGYRGYQGSHFQAENRAFWLKYLKGE